MQGEEGHVKTEVETTVRCPRVQEHQGLLVVSRSWEEAGRTLSSSFQMEYGRAVSLTPDSWPPEQ